MTVAELKFKIQFRQITKTYSHYDICQSQYDEPDVIKILMTMKICIDGIPTPSVRKQIRSFTTLNTYF